MTKAEQLAEQLRIMRHDVTCLTEREVLAETIIELRRLAPIEEDSARYQWLKKRLHSADFDYGEESMCALVFEWPSRVGVGRDLDVNIDAARKALGETK